jgi:hypothetical protein
MINRVAMKVKSLAAVLLLINEDVVEVNGLLLH